MKKNIFPILLFCSSFLFFGCPSEKPPIIPPPAPTDCEYAAGNRNFTWRLDTVGWFPSSLGGIHAFSDSDAYLMGYIGEGKPPWNIFMAKHWDGKKWDTNTNGSYEEIRHYANDVTGDDHFMVSVGYWAIGDEKAGLAEFDNRTKKWKGFQFQTLGELHSVWTDGKGYFIATGDNGMVYTKEGYTAEWVYQKAPTEFNFYKMSGISKGEIYILGYKNLATGESYKQILKYDGKVWITMFDSQDSLNHLLPLIKEDNPSDIHPFRCGITDSLQLYVIGEQSYLIYSKGDQQQFVKINLESLGLPLKHNGRSGLDVNAYSPKDVWVFGTRYNFYHWNGSNFQKIVMPGLPNDDAHFGDQRKMIKTTTGKIFLPTEVSSQVYVVVQGTP